MLINIEIRVKDMFVRKEYEILEVLCKLKLFISRVNLDILEMCFIDVYCKVFWKGNSFFFEIIWLLLIKNLDNVW